MPAIPYDPNAQPDGQNAPSPGLSAVQAPAAPKNGAQPLLDDQGAHVTLGGGSLGPVKAPLNVLDQANADTQAHRGPAFDVLGTLGQGVRDAAMQAWNGMKQAYAQPSAMNLSNGKQEAMGNPSDLYKRGTTAAAGVGQGIETLFGSLLKATGIQGAIEGEIKNMGDALDLINPDMKAVMGQGLKLAGDKYDAWAKQNPDAADEISKWKHIISGALIADQAVEVLPKIPGMADEAASAVFDAGNNGLEVAGDALAPVTERVGGAMDRVKGFFGGIKDRIMGTSPVAPTAPASALPAGPTNPIDIGTPGAEAAEQAMLDTGKAIPAAPEGASIPSDKLAQVKKLGIPDQHLAVVQGATPEDIESMKEMQGRADASLKSMPGSVRPDDVIGEKAVEQLEAVDANRKAIGKALDASVTKMDQTPLDISEAKEYLQENLNKAGVRLTQPIMDVNDPANADKLSATAQSLGMKPDELKDLVNRSNAENGIVPGEEENGLDFSRSYLKNDTGAQKFLKGLNDDLMAAEKGTMTPNDIRTLRQTIFRDMKMGVQQGYLTTSDPVYVMADHTRRLLDEPIRAANDEYRALAQGYAQAKTALRDTYGIAGKAFNEDPQAPMDLRLGEVSQRLGSNASASSQRVFDQLNRTAVDLGTRQLGPAEAAAAGVEPGTTAAEAYGTPALPVDYKRLNAWSSVLDKPLYPETQPTSFGGRIETAVGTKGVGLTKAALEGATGHPVRMAERVFGMLNDRPIEEYRQAYRDLLDSVTFKGGEEGAAGAAVPAPGPGAPPTGGGGIPLTKALGPGSGSGDMTIPVNDETDKNGAFRSSIFKNTKLDESGNMVPKGNPVDVSKANDLSNVDWKDDGMFQKYGVPFSQLSDEAKDAATFSAGTKYNVMDKEWDQFRKDWGQRMEADPNVRFSPDGMWWKTMKPDETPGAGLSPKGGIPGAKLANAPADNALTPKGGSIAGSTESLPASFAKLSEEKAQDKLFDIHANAFFDQFPKDAKINDIQFDPKVQGPDGFSSKITGTDNPELDGGYWNTDIKGNKIVHTWEPPKKTK